MEIRGVVNSPIHLIYLKEGNTLYMKSSVVFCDYLALIVLRVVVPYPEGNIHKPNVELNIEGIETYLIGSE